MEAPLSDQDHLYYQRRHDQERARAEEAQKPEVQKVHQQLANEYAKRIDAGDVGLSRSALRVANPA